MSLVCRIIISLFSANIGNFIQKIRQTIVMNLDINLLTKTGGETGIRTLEALLRLAGFQDQCIQPLCHLSNEKILYGK
tara:strand:- start:2039 stop:2272 length:234 start_codon:yes stop_codon:yes gene_type:complete